MLLSVMNYCRVSFEIVTRIRQMAPLLYIINSRKLRLRDKNETTFISAKHRVDLSSINEVRNYIAEWPRFFGPPCTCMYAFIYYFLHQKLVTSVPAFVTATLLADSFAFFIADENSVSNRTFHSTHQFAKKFLKNKPSDVGLTLVQWFNGILSMCQIHADLLRIIGNTVTLL